MAGDGAREDIGLKKALSILSGDWPNRGDAILMPCELVIRWSTG